VTAPRTLDQLLAVEAIKQLKARYFLFMDTKQWESWRQLFTEDLRTDGTLVADNTRDFFVNGVRDHLEGVRSAHHGHMPLIEVTSETTARGIWAMFDDLRFPENHPWSGEYTRRIGYGHYEEEYRRVNGEWKISLLRLARLQVWSEPDNGAEVLGGLPTSSERWL
jgi:hypothetical protein